MSKHKRMFIRKAKEAGLKIAAHRLSKGSHSYFTVEYRGYWRKFTVVSSASSIFTERLVGIDIEKFKCKVDDLHNGLEVDLGAGTPGAIFRCTDDT